MTESSMLTNDMLQASHVHSCNVAESNKAKSNAVKIGFREFINQAVSNFMATEGLLIALTYIFILTFICFPGLSDDTHFTFLAHVKNEANWYNLLCLMIFNGMDLTGRYIGGSPCADLDRKIVIMISGLRTIFIVTFLLIAFEVSPVWLF